MTECAHNLTIKAVLTKEAKVEALLEKHHALMRASSPEESCHVMTADELRASGAMLFGAWEGNELLAIGAYKAFSHHDVELKSMHTAEKARGKGIGKVILAELLNQAKKAGAQHAYLETGSCERFLHARILYETQGFQYCEPFGAYTHDPWSVFMSKSL